jgi:hypothetical protein
MVTGRYGMYLKAGIPWKSNLPIMDPPLPSGCYAHKWCSAGEQMFATIGNHGNEVKVHHLGHQKVPISTNLPGVGGISWHATLPLLAASSHRSVRFWGLEL